MIKPILLALGATLAPAALLAQPPVPTAPEAPSPAVAPVLAQATDPEWMKKTISFEVKDVTALDALKQLVKIAGIENANFRRGPKPTSADERKVSLSMKGVTIGDALRAVSRMAGYRMQTVGRGDKRTVDFIPSADGDAPFSFVFGGDGPAAIDIGHQIRSAMATADGAIRYATITAVGAPALPDKRVKLDVRKKNVRDILKDVLKQAGLAYSLEDGVPENEARTFTFENVPIGTALDAICRSIDVGWRAEEKDGKTVVRIGKAVRGRAQYLGSPGADGLFDSRLAPIGRFTPEMQKEMEKALADAQKEVRKALEEAEKARKKAEEQRKKDKPGDSPE